ncbi:MAG: NUDIX hydrolase [Bacteroidota bacterium]
MRTKMAQITRVAAYGLVHNDDKILLCRLSDQIPKHAGKWSLPGGGIEFGEDPAKAMIREVHEETGLTVRPIKLAGIDSRHIDRNDQALHLIRIIYFAQNLGGVLTNEVDGSTDLCKWCSIEEANALPLVDLTIAGLGLAFPKSV